jgi:hypothetical protein
MTEAQISRNLISCYYSLEKTFDGMDYDYMIDQDLDVDVVEAMNILMKVIKQIKLSDYQEIMKSDRFK